MTTESLARRMKHSFNPGDNPEPQSDNPEPNAVFLAQMPKPEGAIIYDRVAIMTIIDDD